MYYFSFVETIIFSFGNIVNIYFISGKMVNDLFFFVAQHAAGEQHS